jgi:hypothetical protein
MELYSVLIWKQEQHSKKSRHSEGFREGVTVGKPKGCPPLAGREESKARTSRLRKTTNEI